MISRFQRNIIRWCIAVIVVLVFVGTSVRTSPLIVKDSSNCACLGGFTPTDDTYIAQSAPSQVGGGYEFVSTRNMYGTSAIWEEDTLIKFDLSSIPSGTTIYSAILNLYYYDYHSNNPAGRPITLHKITSDWSEETACWNNKPNYDANILASTTVPSSFGWMQCDVTGDVQSIVNGGTNYGWQLMDEQYWGGGNIPTAHYKSKEYGGDIPFLIVNNQPPTTPQISGPANGTISYAISFTFTATDPDADQLYYQLNWGDGHTTGWLGPYGSGQPMTQSHSWTAPGEYTISAQAKDVYGAESGWGTFAVHIMSNPPNTPQITGASSGKAGQSYDYTFITSDPDGDQIYYWIDWGDGQTNQWIGPYASAQPLTLPHTWAKRGTYVVQAKAKDPSGAESAWGTLSVTMPLSNAVPRTPFLERLFERFPHLLPLLRHILAY